MTGEVMARRLVRLLQCDTDEAKAVYSESRNIGAFVDQYIQDWEHACVVIVGGRARNHSLRLPALCTCRECILYAACEHTVFVEGLDLPLRARIRNFDFFKS
jgi:hypothetical protein